MDSIGTPGRSIEPSIAIAHPPVHAARARQLRPEERAALAMRSLRRDQAITRLACDLGVSRKFVHQQKRRAQDAIDEAFRDDALPDGVIGYLPVTKRWLHRTIVSSALDCHGSMRGICQHVQGITGLSISEGTVFNVIAEAVSVAKAINDAQDLSAIHEGAHDEIFSQRVPVLVGVEPRSDYLYLLEPSNSRDEAAWWVALTDKHERQGLNLTTSISDAARGLRAGVRAAFPDVDLRGDVLHAQMELSEVLSYLENRAYGRMTLQEHEERKMARAKRHQAGRGHSKRLARARARAGEAMTLHDDLAILIRWLTELLQLIGPAAPERRELWDWLVGEMQARAPQSHRIGPLVTYLKNQRDALLAFVPALRKKLEGIAASLRVPSELVQAVYEQFGMDPDSPRFEAIQRHLGEQAPDQADAIDEAVETVLDQTLRASSAVENINSILRGYFFLRRSVGPEFLHLLQFYLNHRRFRRSRRPERVGKSPRELLSGCAHADWLSLLGYGPATLVN